MAADGDGAAACPSCAATLAKMPQRKTKCRACGQFMFVRSTPDNRVRRLLTEAQVQAAELAWRDHQAKDQAARELAMFGSQAADIAAPAAPPDVDAAIKQAHQLARGGRQAATAVVGLYRAAKTPTEALAAHMAMILIDLQQAQRMAFTAQLRCGVRHPSDHCAPCDRLHGTIISTDTPIEAVAPLDCPHLLQPVGRLRRGCNVLVQAWIKKADGSAYLDRRPTPTRAGPPMTAEQIEQARQAWSGVLGVELPHATPSPAPAEPAEPKPRTTPWWRGLLGRE